MANGCPENWVWSDAVNGCVYQPVDYTEDPSYTGGTELGDIETQIVEWGFDWEDFGDQFQTYGDTEWWELEDIYREGAESGISGLLDLWGIEETGLTTGWYGDPLGPDGIPNTGDEYIGRRGQYLADIAHSTSQWGLSLDEFIRREGVAGTDWASEQTELNRLRDVAWEAYMLKRGDLESAWDYEKSGLGLSARSGLMQAMISQEEGLSKLGFATAGSSAFNRMQRDIREGYARDVEYNQEAYEYSQEEALGEYSGYQGGLGWVGDDPTTEELEGGWAGGTYEKGLNAYNAAMGAIDYERTSGQLAHDREIENIQFLLDTGQITYDQAIKEGQTRLGLDISDINRELETSIWDTQKKWREDQRDMLEYLDLKGAFLKIEGCTHPNATNYDEAANVDDGSCEFSGDDLNRTIFSRSPWDWIVKMQRNLAGWFD